MRAADAVDVIGDSDQQRGLSAVTPSLGRKSASVDTAVCWRAGINPGRALGIEVIAAGDQLGGITRQVHALG